MEIEVIRKENLSSYQGLMLSYIYEELSDHPEEELDTDYICLAATVVNADGIVFPVSVLICQMEPIGDLNILSIFTLPEYRRQGYASALIDKMFFVARHLFIWDDEDEPEESVTLKTIYRLRPELESVYVDFLKKNHFADFFLLDDDGEYKVWAAMAEIIFYRSGTDHPEKPDDTESQDPKAN